METRPLEEGARTEATEPRRRRPAFRKLAKGLSTIESQQAFLAMVALATAIETGRSVWCVADPTHGDRAIVDALLHGGFTALLLVGAIRLPVRPWLWSGVIALAWVGWAMVRNAIGLGPEAAGDELWLGLGLGAVLVHSMGLRTLVERHPGSISARRLAALGWSDRPAATVEHRRLRSRTQERLARRVRGTLAAFSVATVLGIAAVFLFLRPEPGPLLLERFRRAWNETGLEVLATFGKPRARWWSADPDELARTNWPELGALDSFWTDEGNPSGWLEDPRRWLNDPRRPDTRLQAQFALADGSGSLCATFWVDGTGWTLSEVGLLRPRLAPGLEEFRAAWNEKDLARIREGIDPGAREKVEETLGWLEGRPWKRLETPRTETCWHVPRTLFPCAGGGLEVRWRQEPGEPWRIGGLDWIPSR